MMINLKGSWKLTGAPDFKDNIIMTLPGDIHSALIEKGFILDPYYGKNELDIQWVGKTDWTAEKTFTVTKNFLHGRQFITLEGADTFVRIFINEKETGFCLNAFRRWRFDVTDALIEGTNTIRLVFESAEKHATKEAKKVPYTIPDSTAPVYSPHRNFVRKTQCHGGWDWGPCIMASGIYGSIYLEQTTTGFVDYIRCSQAPDGETDWLIAITVTYTALTAGKRAFTFTVSAEKNSSTPFETHSETVTAFVQEGETEITHTMRIKNPERWYPAGCRPEDTENILKTGFSTLHENTMYDVTVSTGKSTLTKKIAFRTLETISEEDEHGKSLYFRVNGRPVFVKGSNWIPSDALPARQTIAKYKRLLSDLVASNQNCIRVWGGGQYENDIFYELCDRKGIIVWQDCMFACSLYPAHKEFLDNVREEMRHQIRRLQTHASIALWCGNNEIVGAFGWYKESKDNLPRYLVDYDRLMEGVVGAAIRSLDPSRAWWPSSPSAGPDDFSDNWHTDGRGDMHYWSVWHEGKPFEAYYDIKPRFVSEFGYQSFPSFESVQSYAPADQWNLTSPVMEFHQCNKRGNSIIIENFSRYYRFPEGFKNILYLSQVQQAAAIKTAVDYWRTLRPVCMGSIIWQLNDVWPVASWSSIEYNGKWKLLHYAAKNFFAPLHVSLYRKDGTVKATILNDTESTVTGEITLLFISFDGTVRSKKSETVTVQNDSVLSFFTEKEDSLPKDCFMIADSATFGTDTLFLTAPKEADLQKPYIKASVRKVSEQNENQAFAITLTAEKPAFYVSLDVTGISGVFSNNMLTLINGKDTTVLFKVQNSFSEKGHIQNKQKAVSEYQLRKNLHITSLRDTYC